MTDDASPRSSLVGSWLEAPAVWYERYGFSLSCLALFLLPLKLSLTYIALIPLIALWMAHAASRHTPVHLARPEGALLLWTGVALTTSLFGFAPLHSTQKLLALAFVACTPLVLYEQATERGRWYLFGAAIAGQSIAAFHSILEGGFPASVSSFFLGKVTESGQLALVLPLALGVVSSTVYRLRAQGSSRSRLLACVALGVLTAVLGILTAFGAALQLSGNVHLISLAIWLVALVGAGWWCWRTGRGESGGIAWGMLVLGVAIPLMIGALCINLKRGPWAGVLIATVVYLAFLEKRLIPLTLAVALAVALVIEPVRDRLLQSSQHFFIVGGRSEMWSIGLELLLRYPLGIGFDNSALLQHFSPDIPPELEHFHNNFINVATETGALGLAFYLWWIGVTLRGAFSQPARGHTWMLPYALGCSVIAWQCAGFVEYNFGDSEVKLLAFALLGILGRLADPRPASASASRIGATEADP